MEESLHLNCSIANISFHIAFYTFLKPVTVYMIKKPMVLVLSTLILSNINRKKYSQFIGNLEKIDKQLNTSEIIFEKYRKSFIKVLLISFVYSIILISTNSLTWFVQGVDFKIFLDAFNMNVVNLIFISYIVEIFIITNHTKTIGEYLKMVYWNNLPQIHESDQFLHISEKYYLFVDEKFWSVENRPLFKLLSSYEKNIRNIQLINNIYGVQVNIFQFNKNNSHKILYY